MNTTSLPDVYKDMAAANRVDRLIIERIAVHLRGPRVLTMGYAGDCWPDLALERGYSVDIVEGLASNVEEARAKYGDNPRVRIFHVLFEELPDDLRYDCVIAGNIIELYSNPNDLFGLVERLLAPGGVAIITTPNTGSLHRRIGAYLGLEQSRGELNARAVETGCHHLYEMYSLGKALRDYGFSIIDIRGLFLKPLSTEQMAGWNDELLRAFMMVGDEVPGDLCKHLAAVVSRG